MTTITRIARFMWDASIGRHSVAEELKDDPGMADDGLIGFTVVGTVVTGLTTLELIPTLLAPVISPLIAVLAAFVLRLVGRIAHHPATMAETVATVTLTSLPLLLIPIPMVGAPVGVTAWLLVGIIMLHRVTLARLNSAAIITLLSHALTVGLIIGVGFGIEVLV